MNLLKNTSRLFRASAVLDGYKAEDDGTVIGYASTFGGEPDSHGDIIAPGAFAKSLARHKAAGTMPALLWSHKQDQPIGKWTAMREDAHGLLAEGSINLLTGAGRDAWEHLKAGDADGFSIGYRIPAGGEEFQRDGSTLLKEIDLYEVSVVVLPSNRSARVGAQVHQLEIRTCRPPPRGRLGAQCRAAHRRGWLPGARWRRPSKSNRPGRANRSRDGRNQEPQMTIIMQNRTLAAATAHLVASATPLLTKEATDPLDLLAKKFGDHVSEVLTKLGATNQDLAGIKEQLAELEQKAARTGYSGGEQHKSIGAEFTESDPLKSFLDVAASGKGGASLSIKATITSATTNAAGSVGAGLVATRDADYVALAQRRMTVRDLLPAVQVSSNSVEVMRQKARNLNAGMVAEGAAKPESDLQMELVPIPIRTIAHWMKASRQVLDDMPQLRGIIDGELIYGLKLVEENQLLNGDGTGQNINGLVPQATAYAAPFTIADATMIDQLGLAILQNALALYPADGIVVNAADWMRMRLLKNGDGEYILGDPAKDVAKVLFGVPVVDTPAMTVDKFLVGNFQAAATVYDRWAARIEAAYVADDFTKNLITILGEERIGLAVKRPTAMTYGDFGNVT